ncbi:hypothetical protein HPT27_01425 [Permianibacter sp. IMCC34836]|uniref:hypothetical protein n=1 Tax=Permianibacter fluminis TaxID=2738515 RepID=UPI001551C716|nr:hypothetical protein [Permianibacter fluminis]NQD35663.1 hypothetical protein [Permianibacter fluminis]
MVRSLSPRCSLIEPLPGLAPAGEVLSLAQRKYPKKHALYSSPTKHEYVLSVPCAAQGLAAAAELALHAQTVLADYLASPFRCSARQTGGKFKSTLRAKPKVPKQRLLLEHGAPSRQPAMRRQRPGALAGIASAALIRQEPHQCVPEAMLSQRRAGLTEAAEPFLARLGRVSFGYFSLHEQRKVARQPGRDPALPVGASALVVNTPARAGHEYSNARI